MSACLVNIDGAPLPELSGSQDIMSATPVAFLRDASVIAFTAKPKPAGKSCAALVGLDGFFDDKETQLVGEGITGFCARPCDQGYRDNDRGQE